MNFINWSNLKSLRFYSYLGNDARWSLCKYLRKAWFDTSTTIFLNCIHSSAFKRLVFLIIYKGLIKNRRLLIIKLFSFILCKTIRVIFRYFYWSQIVKEVWFICLNLLIIKGWLQKGGLCWSWESINSIAMMHYRRINIIISWCNCTKFSIAFGHL